MKKIFTLALAGMAAISTMAAPLPASKVNLTAADLVRSTELKRNTSMQNQMRKALKNAPVKKALDADNFYGDWGFIGFSCTTGGTVMENISLEKGTKENEVILNNFPALTDIATYDPTYTPLVGTVDFENETVTVEPGEFASAEVKLNNGSTGTVTWSFACCEVETNSQNQITGWTATEDPIELTYNAEAGGLVLPEFTVVTVNVQGKDDLWELYEGAYITPGAAWNDLGMSQWTDGMLASFFDLATDPEANDVRTYESNLVPGYYRFISPWAEIPVFNDGTGPDVNVEVYAMDPDCVMLPLTPTQISSDGSSTGAYYVFNAAVLAGVGQEGGPTVEEFINQYGEMNATLVDGVITFPGVGMGIYQPNMQDAEPALAMEEYAVDTEIVLDTTGIDNIISSDVNNANAPVEFFNIQGQRISNPAAGQLVIRRQGSDVQKLIVR